MLDKEIVEQNQWIENSVNFIYPVFSFILVENRKNSFGEKQQQRA